MQILRARAVLGLYYKTQHEAQASGPPFSAETGMPDASARPKSGVRPLHPGIVLRPSQPGATPRPNWKGGTMSEKDWAAVDEYIGEQLLADADPVFEAVL